MEYNPLCLINCFLAVLALFFYILGSYRLYHSKKGYLLFLGVAIVIDIATAILASLGITPTVRIENTVSVPWYSILFNVHVTFSMIGFLGFIMLFFYLLIVRPSKYHPVVLKWQFLVLLPIWITGESIALVNSVLKITSKIRLFDMI